MLYNKVLGSARPNENDQVKKTFFYLKVQSYLKFIHNYILNKRFQNQLAESLFWLYPKQKAICQIKWAIQNSFVLGEKTTNKPTMLLHDKTTPVRLIILDNDQDHVFRDLQLTINVSEITSNNICFLSV